MSKIQNKILDTLAKTLVLKSESALPRTHRALRMPTDAELAHAKSFGTLEIPVIGSYFSAIFTLLADHHPRADVSILAEIFYANDSLNYSSYNHFVGRHPALAEIDAFGARLLQATVNAKTAKGIAFNAMRNEATQIEPLKNSAILLMMLIRNKISIRSPLEEDSAEAKFLAEIYFKAGQSAADVQIAGITMLRDLESIPTLNARRGADLEFLVKKMPESCDARKFLLTQFQTLRAMGFVTEPGSPFVSVHALLTVIAAHVGSLPGGGRGGGGGRVQSDTSVPGAHFGRPSPPKK